MGPIPSPYFPEPIRVPNNVADGDYRTSVRFVRTVGIAHLLSVAAVFLLTKLWRLPLLRQLMPELPTATYWLLFFAVLALLAVLRRAALGIQTIVFLLLALTLSAAIMRSTPFLQDDLPEYWRAFVWILGSAWFSMLIYHLAAGRDYSFVGAFFLVFAATTVSAIVYSFESDISLGETFAVLVLVSAAIFYWVYDLAMVVRRRTAQERFEAVFDLYRDLLNFAGYPMRVINMPRKRLRYTA